MYEPNYLTACYRMHTSKETIHAALMLHKIIRPRKIIFLRSEDHHKGDKDIQVGRGPTILHKNVCSMLLT